MKLQGVSESHFCASFTLCTALLFPTVVHQKLPLLYYLVFFVAPGIWYARSCDMPAALITAAIHMSCVINKPTEHPQLIICVLNGYMYLHDTSRHLFVPAHLSTVSACLPLFILTHLPTNTYIYLSTSMFTFALYL
jgi:hypothetical protein